MLRRDIVTPPLPTTEGSDAYDPKNSTDVTHFALAPDGVLVVQTLETTYTKRPSRGSHAATIRLWKRDGTLLRAMETIPFEETAPVFGLDDGGKTLVVVFPDHNVKWFDLEGRAYTSSTSFIAATKRASC